MANRAQHPKNEIGWEGREKAVLKIKAGDRVWVGEGQHPCKCIKTVTRLTNTLIITGEGKNNWDRFKRNNGFQIGQAMFADYISALATEDEIRAYEAKEAREQQEAKQRSLDTAAREAKGKELGQLFASGFQYVHRSHSGDGLWSVTMSALSEEQVRALACFPLHVSSLINWLDSNQSDTMNRAQVEDHTAIVRGELEKILAMYGR